MKITLPAVVRDFCQQHEILKSHYAKTKLTFTLDGKLVGDLGEATAADAFNLELCAKRTPGVDAHTKCRQRHTVQIKTTGKQKTGPAYTRGKACAKYLLFLRIDFRNYTAEVIYNGPEAPIRRLLPANFDGTKSIRLTSLLAIGTRLKKKDQLPLHKRLRMAHGAFNI